MNDNKINHKCLFLSKLLLQCQLHIHKLIKNIVILKNYYLVNGNFVYFVNNGFFYIFIFCDNSYFVTIIIFKI